MAKDYRLEKRKFVIGGIALSIVLIYLVRLFVLQITTDAVSYTHLTLPTIA